MTLSLSFSFSLLFLFFWRDSLLFLLLLFPHPSNSVLEYCLSSFFGNISLIKLLTFTLQRKNCWLFSLVLFWTALLVIWLFYLIPSLTGLSMSRFDFSFLFLWLFYFITLWLLSHLSCSFFNFWFLFISCCFFPFSLFLLCLFTSWTFQFFSSFLLSCLSV